MLMLLGRTLFIGLFLYILLFLGVFLLLGVGSVNAEDGFYTNNYCKYWLDDKNQGLVEKNEGPKLIKKEGSVLQLEGWPKVFQDNTLADSEDSLGGIVNYFYSISLWLAVLAAFASIIYAGFAYMLSGQSPNKRKDAQDRIKSIFIGIVILLTSVITLNLINPDLNRLDFCHDKEEGGCKIEINQEESSIDIPNIGFLPRSNINNQYQKGIPYSSAETVTGDYKKTTKVSSANCYSCGAINYSIDVNDRDESLKNIQDYVNEPTNGAETDDSENIIKPLEICNANCNENSLKKDEDNSRIVGLDRLKCSLDYNSGDNSGDDSGDSEDDSEEYNSWAIVANSDDNAVLACVGACALIAYEKTGGLSCPEYNNAREFPVVDEEILAEAAIQCEDEEVGSAYDECLSNLRKELKIEYEDANGDGLKAIREFVCRDNNLNCDDGDYNNKDVNEWDDLDDDEWYDGKLSNFQNGWIFWGDKDSPDKNALKIHDEDNKSRAKLRACITDKYLLEAQDLPKHILEHNAKICLCKV